MPGALHVLVAYHTLVLQGLSSPKTWSGKVAAKGSTSSARMLPTQATESARQPCTFSVQENAACYLEEGKEYSQAADVAAAIWEP